MNSFLFSIIICNFQTVMYCKSSAIVACLFREVLFKCQLILPMHVPCDKWLYSDSVGCNKWICVVGVSSDRLTLTGGTV